MRRPSYQVKSEEKCSVAVWKLFLVCLFVFFPTQKRRHFKTYLSKSLKQVWKEPFFTHPQEKKESCFFCRIAFICVFVSSFESEFCLAVAGIANHRVKHHYSQAITFLLILINLSVLYQLST